jgi:hypothetical protein
MKVVLSAALAKELRERTVARRTAAAPVDGQTTQFRLRWAGLDSPAGVAWVQWGVPSADAATVVGLAWDASRAGESDAWRAFEALVGRSVPR